MLLNKINIYQKHTFELDFLNSIAIILFKMFFFMLKYRLWSINGFIYWSIGQ